MSREYSLQQIAERIGAELRGEGDCVIAGLNSLQNAEPGQLTFIASQAYRASLGSTNASAVILPPAMAGDYAGNALLMDNPYLGYARASALFDRTPVADAGIHPSALISASANIHPQACIGANVVIGNFVEVGAATVIGAGCSIAEHSSIGSNGWLSANVSIYHGVRIGDNARIHSGAVIGADGFGFAPDTGPGARKGGWQKIYQLGGVVVGDNVEIGACTTIDRGALDDTVIEDGVILDNHVMIAHNVRVGENTAMAAYSAAAGSAVIGRNCTFSGRSGVVGHVTLCDGVHVAANTSISKSISEPGAYCSGTQVTKAAEWRKNAVRFNQLDNMARRLKKLEKKLK